MFRQYDVGISVPLEERSKDEAIENAVRTMVTGREGLFVLISNRPLKAYEVLELYRARNDVGSKFRDLKHGIDWRPARCTSEDAIRGRILISFLALFCKSMVRFLYPEFGKMTAESISEELSSLSLTVLVDGMEQKRRVFSNFGRIIRRLWYGKRLFRCRRHPDRHRLTVIPAEDRRVETRMSSA